MSASDARPRPGEKVGVLIYNGELAISDEKTIAVTFGKATALLAACGYSLRLAPGYHHGHRHRPPRPRQRVSIEP